jgi:hypothetical protein
MQIIRRQFLRLSGLAVAAQPVANIVATHAHARSVAEAHPNCAAGP